MNARMQKEPITCAKRSRECKSSMRRTFHFWTVAAALLGAALVVACAEGNQAEVGEETEIGQAGEEETARADTVRVSLSEHEIDMPSSIPAGRTVLRVTNEGTVEHNLEVAGQAVEEAFFEDNLPPGETRELVERLEPGSYEVYCPVADHAERGMRLRLQVTETGR